jgi:hypothetical protein
MKSDRSSRALWGRLRVEGVVYYGLGACSEPPTYTELGIGRHNRRPPGPRPGCKFVVKAGKSLDK